ncbi:MAG TPA: phospholipase D-like domain-containing protein [Bacteroidia bacterium]|nr:phospholipase D-like domain-containing protein [Bacteroidia bacterium]
MRFRRRKISSAYNPNNKVKLIRGGKDYFDLLEQLINNAEKKIHFQTYIIDDDDTGRRICNALLKAVKRNVKVFLLLDGYASNSLPEDFIKRLTEGGISFRWFEPFFSSSKFYFGRRLHHKVAVADEKIGLVAGLNIANRYNDINNTPAWLDFAVLVEGQACITLNETCVKVWGRKSRDKKLVNEEKKIFFKNSKNNDHTLVRVRRNDWVRGKHDISKSYIEMFNKAKKNITIMSSYFLPGNIFRIRLKAALRRGVKIRVILAGVSDIALSKYAERYWYAWMLRNNIEIYEYKKTVLHAKVAVCDDEWASIGSYNVNNLSAYASIELNLDIKSDHFIKTLTSEFDTILKNDCEQVTNENYEKQKNIFWKFTAWASYIITRMLLFFFTYSQNRKKK